MKKFKELAGDVMMVPKKCKMSLTIDQAIYSAIENAAEECHVKKSCIIQKAFEFWLKHDINKMMEKGYEEMRDEDSSFAKMVFDAQREIVL